MKADHLSRHGAVSGAPLEFNPALRSSLGSLVAMIETFRRIWFLGLMLGASLAHGQTGAEQYSATCEGRLRLEIQSLKRESPGTILMSATYENLTNFNMRMGVYSGGANGRDTFLVSDTGEMWPKLKGYKGGGGTSGIVFVPGVKMKATMKFQLRSGGQEAKSFHLTNWVQMLAEKGMTGPDEGGWCKFEVKSIPLAE